MTKEELIPHLTEALTDAEVVKAILPKALATLGLFREDGKPNFVSVGDFGKTAAVIGDLKNLSKDAVTRQALRDAGFEEVDGKLVFKGQTAPPAPGAPKPEDEVTKRMQAQMDKLTKDIEERDRLLREKDEAAERDRTHREIQNALTAAGAINPARDYIHLTSAVKKTDDGRLVAVTKNQYGQDEEVPLEKFAEQFLHKQPELKKSTAGAGAGAPANGGSGAPAAGTIRIASAADYLKNRDAIMGGKAQPVFGNQ